MMVFKKANDYNNVREMLLTQLSFMNVIEEMSDLERKEYMKKPTGLNALFLHLKLQMKLANARCIIYGGNEIVYIYDNELTLDNITILNVKGPVSKLSVEEQKKEVIKLLDELREEKNRDKEEVDETSELEDVNKNVSQDKKDELPYKYENSKHYDQNVDLAQESKLNKPHGLIKRKK